MFTVHCTLYRFTWINENIFEFYNALRTVPLKCVMFSGLDANSFKIILDFIYLNKIEVTESNVQFLLPAACLLQILPIVEACATFLKDRLQPSNCLGTLYFARILARL